MMRKIIIFLFILIGLTISSQVNAKSIVRKGKARIILEKVEIPSSVRQEEPFAITIWLKTTENLWNEEKVFLHIIREVDEKLVLNADFSPTPPTTEWIPEQVVVVGPINLYIPEEIPPGKYKIRLGLFYPEKIEGKYVYVREPFVNKEIKNFIVGSIEVKPALKTPPKKETVILADFESKVDLAKWQYRGALLERVPNPLSTPTNRFVGKITFSKDQFLPAIILEKFFSYSNPKYRMWDRFDELRFTIFSEITSKGEYFLEVPVVVQIKDKMERRYHFKIPQGIHKEIKINLFKVGEIVDLSQMGNFEFFYAGTPLQDTSVYIDNVKLVSLGIEKSIKPFIVLKNIKITPSKVKRGSEVTIEAIFSINKKFRRNEKIFIHLYRKADYKGFINADTSPRIPTTEWEINKDYTEGPFKIYIPKDAPLGVYNVEMGFFYKGSTSPQAPYIKCYPLKGGVWKIEQPKYPEDIFKEPYANYEKYGGWIVGEFEVVE